MHHTISVLAVLITLLATAAFAAAPIAPLAYRLPVADHFRQISTITVKSPRGTHTGTVTLACTVKAATPRGMRWAENITVAVSGQPTKQLALELTMPPDGNWADLAVASGPENLARMVQMTLPGLPNVAVNNGSSWVTERVLTLPHTPVPGLPESIRIRSQYKVTGFENAGGRPAVSFTMTAEDTGRQAVSLKATAQYTVNLATGKPIRSHYEGVLTVRVGPMPVKIELLANSSAN
jgi:hypothetical protein